MKTRASRALLKHAAVPSAQRNKSADETSYVAAWRVAPHSTLAPERMSPVLRGIYRRLVRVAAAYPRQCVARALCRVA